MLDFRRLFHPTLVAGVMLGLVALALSGCSTNLTDREIARIDQAVAAQPALAGDVDTTDAYTTQTECAILGLPWHWSGGGSGTGPSASVSFPYCDHDDGAGVGPTVLLKPAPR